MRDSALTVYRSQSKFCGVSRSPHPFMANLRARLADAKSRADRIVILKETGRFATNQLAAEVAKLEDLLLQFNPLQTLATLAFYHLTYLPDLDRRFTEGQHVEQFHIEIIQALILAHEKSEFGHESVTSEKFHELQSQVVYVSILHAAQAYVGIDLTLTDDQISRLQFLSGLQVHTATVRNWGYREQITSVIKGIYAPLDDAIEQRFGVRITKLTDMFVEALKDGEARIQRHFMTIQSVLQAERVTDAVREYLNHFPDREISVEAFEQWSTAESFSLDHVKELLFLRSTHWLPVCYASSREYLLAAYGGPASSQNVLAFIDSCALKHGDLRLSVRSHLFLANPVWARPLIQSTDDIIYWPILPLFHGFCFELFDTFINQDLVLRERLNGRRGDFLEERVASSFASKFPQVPIFKSNKWTGAESGSVYENDLLLVFDSIAVVVEQKAGRINPIARRGGSSIVQEVNQLVSDASEQAHRFATLLRSQGETCVFTSEVGDTSQVNWSSIHEIVCITITLERLGPMATQMPALQDAGLARRQTPITTTMSLADLEILLEIIDSPAELLHYLRRREAVEKRHLVLADELDLLTFYLETGFVDFEDLQGPIMIYGASRRLDSYFLRRNTHDVTKPRRKMTGWWRRILDRMERLTLPRRYELACILLDAPLGVQQRLEADMNELRERGSRLGSTDEFEATSAEINVLGRKEIIIVAVLRPHLLDQRHRIVQELASRAIEVFGTSRVVVMLMDADVQQHPFSGIYLLERAP